MTMENNTQIICTVNGISGVRGYMYPNGQVEIIFNDKLLILNALGYDYDLEIVSSSIEGRSCMATAQLSIYGMGGMLYPRPKVFTDVSVKSPDDVEDGMGVMQSACTEAKSRAIKSFGLGLNPSNIIIVGSSEKPEDNKQDKIDAMLTKQIEIQEQRKAEVEVKPEPIIERTIKKTTVPYTLDELEEMELDDLKDLITDLGHDYSEILDKLGRKRATKTALIEAYSHVVSSPEPQEDTTDSDPISEEEEVVADPVVDPVSTIKTKEYDSSRYIYNDKHDKLIPILPKAGDRMSYGNDELDNAVSVLWDYINNVLEVSDVECHEITGFTSTDDLILDGSEVKINELLDAC